MNERTEWRYETCAALSRTLEDCVERLRRWTCDEVRVTTEPFSKTDFYFVASNGINGGIVWHGKDYGYEIHT